MASARRHQKLLEKTYRRLLADDLRRAPPSAAVELQEADVLWGDHAADTPADPSRICERKRAPLLPPQAAARSVPMDVPEWGREEESEGEGGEVVPPHVYLWRRRRATAAAAFSVEEGRGRTLKGRDLSRMRNAVWDKIGFAD